MSRKASGNRTAIVTWAAVLPLAGKRALVTVGSRDIRAAIAIQNPIRLSHITIDLDMTVTPPAHQLPALPLLHNPPEERSDAARNRQRVLQAAAELITTSGPASLTMDQLARSAGVGKGTVYRRFKSRAGVMLALLDHTERRFQAAIVAGPPPLGPGAPAIERLVAFGRAKLDLVPLQGDMLAAAGEAVYTEGAYWLALRHVEMLLTEARACGDPLLIAQLLLSGLDARLVLHQTRQQNITPARIADNWETAARRLATTRNNTPCDSAATVKNASTR